MHAAKTILLALALILILPASAALADDDQPPRTINTSGDATVYVQPDEVVVNLGVETFNASLDESKSANDAASKKLMAAIRGVGVEAKHIQTDVLNVQIDYAQDGRPARGIEGYICRRGYAVTLKDVKRFEELVDVALKNGANHLMGFEFRTTELRRHRDEARKLAIRAAKEKAEALAAELDMRIGPPRSIGEGSNSYWGYRGGWWGWGGGGYGQYMSQNVAQQAPSGGDSGGETMPLGQIAVRAQINVAFDLVVPAATTATTAK